VRTSWRNATAGAAAGEDGAGSPGIRPRGILNRRAGAQRFRLSLHPPADDLTPFLEHHWIVTWDLRGQDSHVQETLPHPSVHLVFERDASRVVGVTTGKFSVVLRGQGRVYGVKFRPGAFYPFLRRSVQELTDTVASLQHVFDIDDAERRTLEAQLLSLEDEAEMTRLAEDFLRQRRPEADETVLLLNRLVPRIAAERHITRVEDVARLAGLTTRTLQRLFSRYVGVGPKWVIRRYRLLEAAERLAAGETVDLPALALALGYYDQAHFIDDFKAVVGRPPGDYARHQ
jgi:AraC-like DNA-binding protein